MGTTLRKPLTSRELIAHIKANTPPKTVVEPLPVRSAASIANALGSQPSALGTDPGGRPDTGGAALDRNYTSPETERVESSQDGQTNETLGGQTHTEKQQPDPTDENNVVDPDEPVIIEYPEGEPTDKWTRPELDAYALNVKGLDTSTLGNKAAVLAAINAPATGQEQQ